MQRQIDSFKPLIKSGIYTFIVFVIVFLLQNWTQFTEEFYPNFYRNFYPFYTKFFGWFPISIGDIFYSILILSLIWTIILGIRCFVLGQKWRVIRILSRFLFWLTTFYLLFHLLWGFNYYKPNISKQFLVEEYKVQELQLIANDLFAKAIEQRNLVKEDKKGVFDFHRKNFYQTIPKNLQTNANWDLTYTKLPQKNLKKYSIFSFAMRYFGVAGYYNPFTAEAQITRLLPDTSKPFSMAHEQAHQMGYATEYEANFIGFLTCVQSNNPELIYSGNYKALKYVLREIYPKDSTFVRQKLDSFSPGMQRDLAAEKAYDQKYSGVADKAFSAMNNAYLKANNQKEGVESYNRFVELLVGYYREKDF